MEPFDDKWRGNKSQIQHVIENDLYIKKVFDIFCSLNLNRKVTTSVCTKTLIISSSFNNKHKESMSLNMPHWIVQRKFYS